MSNYILVIICLLCGILLKRSKIFSAKFHLDLNKLIIYFFIPLITLLHVPKINFKLDYLWLIISPWIIYIGSITFIKLISIIKDIPLNSQGSLIMTSGIGSISFVGFPLFEMFYGGEGLAYGIILSLAGTFVVCNSIGVATGVYFSVTDKFYIKNLIKKLIIFPPFLALCIALILNFFNYQHPKIIKSILTSITSPFNIIALLAIGYQISFKNFKEIKDLFLLGQLYKLILAPFLIFLILNLLFNTTSMISKICILGAGIGSMSTISIIASEFKLNPKLSMTMTSLGIPISILTLLILQLLIA